MSSLKAGLASRLKAAAIHTGVSAVVAALAAALVFLVWFPHPFELLAGGTSLFLLITSVDLVMGPLITFAVFDFRKRRITLQRDLAVIGLLQLSALAYGLHTIYQARPAVLALEGSRMRVVTVNDVIASEFPSALPEFNHLSLTRPYLVRTASPSTPDEKTEAIFMAARGADLGSRPKYWRPWDSQARAELRSNARQVAPLLAKPGEAADKVRSALREAAIPVDQALYIPILGPRSEGIMLVDARNAEFSGFVAVEAP